MPTTPRKSIPQWQSKKSGRKHPGSSSSGQGRQSPLALAPRKKRRRNSKQQQNRAGRATNQLFPGSSSSNFITTYQLSPKITLRAGDRIRVSKGPYWQPESPPTPQLNSSYFGRAASSSPSSPPMMKMAERGGMTFLGYCERGNSKWIVAHGKSGYASLYIGPEHASEDIPGLIRRPYKITKVRARVRKGRKTQQPPAQ